MSGATLVWSWAKVATVIAPLFAILIAAVSFSVSAVVYEAQLRQLRWTANQELMKVLMDLDKLIIQLPQYHWMVWANNDNAPRLDILRDDYQAKGLLYLHLNMFDMAFGYYTRILNAGIWPFTSAKTNELKDWEGWKAYISNFMAQEYASEVFTEEGDKWFSSEFVTFIKQQASEGRARRAAGGA